MDSWGQMNISQDTLPLQFPCEFLTLFTSEGCHEDTNWIRHNVRSNAGRATKKEENNVKQYINFRFYFPPFLMFLRSLV